LNNEKKENEIRILEDFIRLTDIFPAGRIIPYESPDFIIRISRRKSLGIELTEILPQSASNNKDVSTRLGDSNNYVSQQILETLTKKEEKITLYRKNRLDHYWLIMYTLSEPGPTYTGLFNRLEKRNYQTSFHRIFLYVKPWRKVFELNKIDNLGHLISSIS